jgi:hypothetical protein
MDRKGRRYKILRHISITILDHEKYRLDPRLSKNPRDISLGLISGWFYYMRI